MPLHVVSPGDYIARIAWRTGVPERDIWEHDENAGLRERREPNMLEAGDAVFVPERTPRSLSVTKGTTNRFVARAPLSRVEIALRGRDGPLAGESFHVEGAGEPIQGTTDGDGVAAFEVGMEVERVELVVPSRALRFSVGVGLLDPQGSEGGAEARLRHLGYLPRPDDGDDAAALARAASDFQRDAGLEPTGELDQATVDALGERHGS